MDINIKKLKKIYGDKTILNIEDFSLKGVKSLAIVGPSGGGKSTLLKILGTIEEGEGETLSINNIDLLNKENHKKYLKEVGYVFQSNNLFPNLTVMENITIHLIHSLGYSENEAKALAETWMKRVDILDHKDKKPNEISGGQAQRVAIVRALVTGAKTLILDEPTSALDPKLAYEVMQTLLGLKEETDTIIVTHELNFARKFADYYIFVDDGEIIESGKIEGLFSSQNEKVSEFVKMIEFK